jgi:coatomer subunit beta
MASEQHCTLLLPQDALPSSDQEEICEKLESKKMQDKIEAIKQCIMAMLNGENMPKVLMTVIRFCINCDDHILKKLLMIYWEVVPKYDNEGKLLPEMILVCNALRNDLNHPNEFVRGAMLKFLCKLKEPEILEPLIASIKTNMEHRHSYVRRNACLTCFMIYKTFGADLLPDGPELVERFILAETDISARRNAFLMLYNCSQDAAVEFLMNNADSITKFGDGFCLGVLELTRKVCRSDPTQKARFVRVIFQLLGSESAAVSYEAAWTLVSLSAAPTAVRAAATTYSTLLQSQSDNNVKLIVLDRLQEIKSKHTKVLTEILMDILRALNSPNSDIREKTLGIGMDLVTPRNIEEVINLLKREIVKTSDKGMEKASEYRQMLIKAIHACAVKFPDTAATVVPVLMDFLNGDGALDVILFIRQIVQQYEQLRPSVVQKLITCLPDIKATRVFRIALWVIGEYVGDFDDVKESLGALTQAMGDLPLVASEIDTSEIKPDAGTEASDEVTTKTVMLSDGTYGTELIHNAAASNVADDDIPQLRKLLVGGDLFLGAGVACALTKLALRAIETHGAASTIAKEIVVDVMLRLCALASLTQAGEVDADVSERIVLCLRVLSQPATTSTLKETFLNACRESFATMLREQEETLEREKEDEEPEVQAQADDLISIRQLRGTKVLGSTEIDIDDGTDLGRALGTDGEKDFTERLNHVHQLSGFADPVYAEAYVTVHDYDIVLEILLINRTPQTLSNLVVELATMGDLKIVERPQSYTIGPLDQRTIKANIKVSSTETGHIFGTIVYDSQPAEGVDGEPPKEEKVIVNLNDIHLVSAVTCLDLQKHSPSLLPIFAHFFSACFLSLLLLAGHHGLHLPRILLRHRFPCDVGGVRVGEQGGH